MPFLSVQNSSAFIVRAGISAWVLLSSFCCSQENRNPVDSDPSYGDFSPLAQGATWTYEYRGNWIDSVSGQKAFYSTSGRKVFRVQKVTRLNDSTFVEVIERDSAVKRSTYLDSTGPGEFEVTLKADLRYLLSDVNNVISVDSFNVDYASYFTDFLFPTVVPWFYFHSANRGLLEDPNRLKVGQVPSILYDFAYGENDALRQIYRWDADRGLVIASFRDGQPDRMESDTLFLVR